MENSTAVSQPSRKLSHLRSLLRALHPRQMLIGTILLVLSSLALLTACQTLPPVTNCPPPLPERKIPQELLTPLPPLPKLPETPLSSGTQKSPNSTGSASTN